MAIKVKFVEGVSIIEKVKKVEEVKIIASVNKVDIKEFEEDDKVIKDSNNCWQIWIFFWRFLILFSIIIKIEKNKYKTNYKNF